MNGNIRSPVVCECMMVNNGSRCTTRKNNREGGPPPGSDPCHRNNNEKAEVLEPWKYEVTKGALCVGIDMVRGWHCAPSRGWSSSQDQMPKLGQGEERESETGRGCWWGWGGGGGGLLILRKNCGSLFYTLTRIGCTVFQTIIIRSSTTFKHFLPETKLAVFQIEDISCQ